MITRVSLTSIIILVLVLFSCSSPIRTTLENAVQEKNAPHPSPSIFPDPDTMSILPDNKPLIITFNKVMNPRSLVLYGSLAEESDGGLWSSTKLPSDTLTISPQDRWSTGSGKSLGVKCTDSEGYQARDLEWVFAVLDGTIYVHSINGNDSYPGTRDLPLRTIQRGVIRASDYFEKASVHVAAGVYTVFSRNDSSLPVEDKPGIFLKDGISLHGGYSPYDWNLRNSDPDKEEYRTIIRDVNQEDGIAVIMARFLTREIVIEGFTIESGGGPSACGIVFINTHGNIMNNRILLSRNTMNLNLIRVTNGSLYGENNRIDCIDAQIGSIVFASNCKLALKDNIIKGKKLKSDFNTIIFTESATVMMKRNTIMMDMKDEGELYGVYIVLSNFYLENNTLLINDDHQGAKVIGYHVSNSLGTMDGNILMSYSHIIEAFLGVNLVSSKMQITNSIIYAYSCGQIMVGLGIINSDLVYQNNLLIFDLSQSGTSSPYPLGAFITGYSQCRIDNNIFQNSPALLSVGLVKADSRTQIESLRNNLFFGFLSPFVDENENYYSSFTSTDTIQKFERMGTLAEMLTGNLIEINPWLVPEPKDFTTVPSPFSRFTTASPVEVTQGGLDFSSSFSTDILGNLRTVPWSMGPYEQD
jgi:hypothetical protein